MKHFANPIAYLLRPAGFVALFAVIQTATLAALPRAELILPTDTLFVFSIPDCAKMRVIYKSAPQTQFWNDPAMKPFREKFIAKWKEEFVAPLERELGVKLDDYADLPQGQFTVAITQNDWQAEGEGAPGVLLMLDAKDKRDQLKKNLAELRKKWVDAGKSVRTEKIRNVDFVVMMLSSNDVPRTIKKFFPQKQQIQELGKEPEKPSTAKSELILGQFDSLLILGTSVATVEKAMLRLTGGSAPALAESAGFEANRLTTFRDAPLFAWLNAKAFFDVLNRTPPEEPNPEAPNPVPALPIVKLIPATGLNGLKSAAFAFRSLPEGTMFELYLGVPESSRQGILQILAADAKESSPPPFVPADAVKFQRWRIDGQKAVVTLEKMLGDVASQWLRTWNFVLSQGEEAVKQNDPGYNLRRNLFGNLGNDFITYEKAPRGLSLREIQDPPSILLVGSPNAEQLFNAMPGLLVIPSQQALAPDSREFLGRKIYSLKMPPLPLIAPGGPWTLNYAARAGYVAFSSDNAMIEEFLRSSDGQNKALRDTPGLTDATQAVGGPGTGSFGFENQSETMRLVFEVMKKFGGGPTNAPSGFNPITSSIPYASPEKSYKQWLDYSLLPEFGKVSKYFHFTVHAGSANVDGLTYKFFSPTPPALKKQKAAVE